MLWKKREKNETAIQERAEMNKESAREAEEKAAQFFDTYSQSNIASIRQLERALVCAEADKKAWKTLWPQEALRSKFQDPQTEEIYTTALETEDEEAWSALEREAQEIESLCDAVIQKIQQEPKLASTLEKIQELQELWSERATIAKGKIAFAPFKKIGTAFSEAMENYFKNPDATNAETIRHCCYDIKEQVAQTTKEVHDVGLSQKEDFAASLRHLENAANAIVDSFQIIFSAAGNKKVTVEKISTQTIQQLAIRAAKGASKASGAVWEKESAFVAVAIQQAADFLQNAWDLQELQKAPRSRNSIRATSPTLFSRKQTKSSNKAVAAYIIATLKAQEKALVQEKAALKKKEERLVLKEQEMAAERKTGLEIIQHLTHTLAEERASLMARIEALSSEKETWEKWKEDYDAAVVSKVTLEEYQEAMARIEAEEEKIANQRIGFIQQEIELMVRAKALEEQEATVKNEKETILLRQKNLEAQQEMLVQEKAMWAKEKETLTNLVKQKDEEVAQERQQAQHQQEQVWQVLEEVAQKMKQAEAKATLLEVQRQEEQARLAFLEAERQAEEIRRLEARRQEEEREVIAEREKALREAQAAATAASTASPSLLRIAQQAIGDAIDEVRAGGAKREKRIFRALQERDEKIKKQRVSSLAEGAASEKRIAEEEARKEAARIAAEEAAQQEKEAAVVRAAQVAKELAKAITRANADWQSALQLQKEADQLKEELKSDSTKDALKGMADKDEAVKKAWVKAAESKRIVLSKTAESGQASLLDEIATAESISTSYAQRSAEARARVTEMQQKNFKRKFAEMKAQKDQEEKEEKEYQEAVSAVMAVWKKASEHREETRKIKEAAEHLKTEDAYLQLATSYQATADLWDQVSEAKQLLATKPCKKTAKLSSDIELAERIKDDHLTRAADAFTKAKEAALREAEAARAKQEEEDRLHALALEQAREKAQKAEELQVRLKAEAEAKAEAERKEQARIVEEEAAINAAIERLQPLSLESRERAVAAYAEEKEVSSYRWDDRGWNFLCAVDPQELDRGFEMNDEIEPLRNQLSLLKTMKATFSSWQRSSIENQRLNDPFNNVLSPYADRKKKEGDSWSGLDQNVQLAIKQLEKAAKATAEKKWNSARYWREASFQTEQFNDFYRQIAEAYRNKISMPHENEFYSAKAEFNKAADSLEDIIRKIEKEPFYLNDLYEIADLTQRAMGFFIKAAGEAINERSNWNKSAGMYWSDGGKEFKKCAEHLLGIINARADNKKNLIESHQCFADQAQKSGNSYIKLAESNLRKTGRRDKGEEKGSSLVIEQIRRVEVKERLSGLIQEAKKAIEADVRGDAAQAKSLRELIRQSQLVQYAFQKASNLHSDVWHTIGNEFERAAQQLKKIMELRSNGEHVLADALHETLVVYGSGNIHLGNILHLKNTFLLKTPPYLEKAAKAEEAGRSDVAAIWQKIEQHYQSAVDSFEKARAAYKGERGREYVKGNSYFKMGNNSLRILHQLEKATKEEEAGNSDRTKAWSAVVQKNERLQRLYEQERSEGYSESRNSVILNAMRVVQQLERAIESEKNNKPEIAALRRDIARLYERSCEALTKRATAYAAGKAGESASWRAVGNSFYHAAEKLEKALESQASGNLAAAEAWRDMADLQEQSVSFYEKAVEAYAAKKRAEAESWRMVGDRFYDAAEELKKGVEAEALGEFVIAAIRRGVANDQEQAATFYTRSAKAYAAGKIEKGASWCTVGHTFLKQVTSSKKAILAKRANKQEAEEVWSKVAEKYGEAYRVWKKRAEAVTAGNLLSDEEEAKKATRAAEQALYAAELFSDSQGHIPPWKRDRS